ncbi:hypothetical protein FACS1894176_01650 [Bacteroidia bacterium]|nr:hypothetical protein FACS1894176_01650 [Bacteroidia bacterium]
MKAKSILSLLAIILMVVGFYCMFLGDDTKVQVIGIGLVLAMVFVKVVQIWILDDK